MAKPKSPLLSLGARGTIADTLTFQKRGREHFARVKPIPKDPKSPAQLAWRQIYRDAVAVWNALTAEEKEAWRGVCPGLTAYQCFMRSELKYVPPPILIDIGLEAIDRANTLGVYTIIVKDNPANAAGTITSIEIWANAGLSDVEVATFYEDGPTAGYYSTRATQAIGSVTAGSKQTFPVSIEVQEGDLIGIYYTAGIIEADASGYAGIWAKGGDNIPCTSLLFPSFPSWGISLYGKGEGEAT